MKGSEIEMGVDAAALDVSPEGLPPASGQPWPTRRSAHYSLFVLTIVVLFTVVDRQVLALMIEPLKADFKINDTEAALLLGAAFSLTYAIAGLPIARIADRGNRRNLVAISVAFWSLATMLCGIAQNYWQVFAARLGVGIGESGYGPATWSITTDNFPREKVAFATGTLAIGAMAGIGVALFLGGTVLQFVQHLPPLHLPFGIMIRPWQWAFLIVGFPGLIWALVVLTTEEPARRGMARAKKAVPVMDVVRWMGTHWRVYLAVIGGACMKNLITLGPIQWMPTMFHRQFGWELPRVGLILGAITVVVSPVGMILGGKLSERWAGQGRSDANMRIVLWSLWISVPATIAAPLFPDPTWVLVVYAISVFFSTLGTGPSVAASQVITPNTMRAQVGSVSQFSSNVIAFALGPLIVALFTDYLFHDPHQLRYSMALSAAVIGPIGIAFAWQGLKAYGRLYDYCGREFPD